MITGKMYDHLKFFALVLLPGLGALYFGVAQIWGLPAAEEVVGTVTVVDTFLGLLLRASNKAYDKSGEKYAGEFVAQQEPDGTPAGIRIVASRDPLILDEDQDLLFKVRREQAAVWPKSDFEREK